MFTSDQLVRARVDAQMLVASFTEGLVLRQHHGVDPFWVTSCDRDVLRSLKAMADELGFDLVARDDRAAQAHVEAVDMQAA